MGAEGCVSAVWHLWRDWRRLGKSEREEQVVPGREDQIGRDRCELAEEVVAGPKLGPCVTPEFIADVANGMEGEGQQVQAHQDGCEILLPVSEVVLKVVTLVLQDIERLVLDFPPGPATGGKFDDGVGTDGQIGDKVVAIRRLALGIDDLDLEPVDRQRIPAVAQRHAPQPAIAMNEALLATLNRLLEHRQGGADQVFLDRLVRLRLADEQDVAGGRHNGLADRLSGEQVVAEVDRIERGIALTMGGQPPLCRPILAILLLRPVPRDDEFGIQRDNLVMPGRHQRRRQHAVVILLPAVASDPGRAVRAMNLPRTMILRAVERNQHAPIKAAEHVEAAVDPLKLGDGFREGRMQQRRGDRVEYVADVVVAGDFGDAEQAGAVGAAMRFLKLALMRQERRALHEKHREGRHSDVAHAVGRVDAPALVRKPVQAASQ